MEHDKFVRDLGIIIKRELNLKMDRDIRTKQQLAQAETIIIGKIQHLRVYFDKNDNLEIEGGEHVGK